MRKVEGARRQNEAFRDSERPHSLAKDGVRSIERALAVLATFSRANPEQSLGVISSSIGLPKSTTHRLLQTLEQTGFVVRGRAAGAYRLGPRTAVIGSVAQQSQVMDVRVQQTLEELRDRTGETVALSTLVGRKLLMVIKAESEQALRYSLAEGLMAPAHTCAGGKALLACLPNDEVRRLYSDSDLETPTSKSIGSIEELLVDLEQARSRGYAVDDEEWGVGLRALGVPVQGRQGSANFAVSLCAPSARVSLNELVGRFPVLNAGADRLAGLLGG